MKRIALICAAVAILAGCGSEPQTFEELTSAGKTAFAKSEFAQARDYLGKAVTMKTSDREALYFLGMAYSRDAMYDSAMFYLGRVNVLFPKDRSTNQELYKLAINLQDWGTARQAIGVLIETGDPPESHWEDLAHLCLAGENYHLAHRYFSLLLEVEPDNPNRYIEVANTAAEIDSMDLAMRVIDSALVRFGQRDEFLTNKALFLSSQRDYPAAEHIYRRLVAGDTSSVGYRINLAHTLAEQDDRAKKEEAYILYRDLKDRIGQEFNIDSLMQELEVELKIE